MLAAESDNVWHGFKNIDDEHMYLDPIKGHSA
jgi:arginine/lysine/ornithine decarboxylase